MRVGNYFEYSDVYRANISSLYDNRKIAALHLHLTGPALTWFNALLSEHKSSWDSIVQLFQTKYVDLDWQSPTVMLDSEMFEDVSLSSGHLISKDGIQPPPDRITAIQEYPSPRSVRELRRTLVAEPIPNKDSLTVAEVLFKLVSKYGVCDTIISDRGSEATTRAIKEVCRLLEITHQYSPIFTHHCLGLCERTHRTFADRMTPYIQKGKRWEDMVPSVLFSLNSTASESVKYSLFEILYDSRSKFPFIISGHARNLDLSSIPKDYHEYLRKFSERLDVIRNEVNEQADSHDGMC
ncbi:unnamed protein product [Mytilus coruscus]|uniref:Integrase catalytic domain-containing protein n=1 Tax=Mytilus coruscus TaxID=42192 RepID=A0A6J8BE75_MYTCO|nr:unnamed protein product [Mytilus coruscus]